MSVFFKFGCDRCIICADDVYLFKHRPVLTIELYGKKENLNISMKSFCYFLMLIVSFLHFGKIVKVCCDWCSTVLYSVW